MQVLTTWEEKPASGSSTAPQTKQSLANGSMDTLSACQADPNAHRVKGGAVHASKVSSQCGCRLRSASSLLLEIIFILSFTCLSGRALAQNDNGIHVGSPKVYDSRELTLMLDNLSQQLQSKNPVDPKALAAALGNIQGYQSSDFSLSAFGNLAVGSQAASVLAGAGAGSLLLQVRPVLRPPPRLRSMWHQH